MMKHRVLPERPWFRFWPEGVPRHVEYPEVPLPQLLSDTASRYPEGVAFSAKGNNLTYNQLDELTLSLIHISEPTRRS